MIIDSENIKLQHLWTNIIHNHKIDLFAVLDFGQNDMVTIRQ